MHHQTNGFHRPGRSASRLAAGLAALLAGASPASASVFTLPETTFTTAESGQYVWAAVVRSASTNTESVELFTTDGTAVSGVDYVAGSQLLTFAPGESVKGVRFLLVDNTAVQGARQFNLGLRNATGGGTVGSPATATVTIADDDDPAVAGQWGPLLSWPAVALHAHLSPAGRVIHWERFPDNVLHTNTPLYEWNPTTNTTASLTPASNDIFCSGHGWTADGKLLVAGGHIDVGIGLPTADSYNPATNTWNSAPPLNAGRWYPTMTTLANGDVLVVGGSITPGVMNMVPQVLDRATGLWRDLTTAVLGEPSVARFYPFLYQAQNGQVFCAGPEPSTWYLNPAGTGSWSFVGSSQHGFRQYGTSAMFDDGYVLIAGGNPPDSSQVPQILPSRSAEQINLNGLTPKWRAMSPMLRNRRQNNATLLPDGTVFMSGGSSSPGNSDVAGAVLTPEIWNPGPDAWTAMAAELRPRLYHSTALLLPDGRVVSAGSGLPAPTGGVDERNAQVFSPPYLFKGPRPSITSAQAILTYGQSFPVQTPDAGRIAKVNLLRIGSVTHAFNMSQRICHASFTINPGVVQVTAPASSNDCPPGHYMLFLVDTAGVPSVAPIVLLAQSPAAGQADAAVRTKKGGTLAGDNIYNTTGVSQTGVITVPRGGQKFAQIVVQNDGPATDGFVVSAPPAAPGFTVRYFLGSQTGPDITAAVTGSGYLMAGMPSGRSQSVILAISVASSTPLGATARVTCTVGSAAQLNVRDVAVVAVTAQ